MGRVVSVGAITVDVTSFSVRLPKPGETLIGTGFSMVPGGKGANQAVAAARAGASTAMVGCVGDDHFADLALASLAGEGVDTTAVDVVPGMTGVAHIRVDASAENDIVVIPLANSLLSTELVEEALGGLGDEDVVLVQLEVDREVSMAAIRLGKQVGARVILDPAPAVDCLPDQVWDGLYAVTPNESEAQIITGYPVTDSKSAARAGRWFVERGVRLAIITLADQGVVVVSSSGAQNLAAFEVAAVDTTAAGDAFTGCLAAGLARGVALDLAIKSAMAAGALAVTKVGASTSLPTAAQVERFLASR